MERDNSSRELAKKIIDAQMDLFEKVNNDFKIINNKIDDIKRNVPNI